MFYCENCNLQNQTNRCAKCGRKNLRQVQAEDFCFFRRLPANKAENLKATLEAKGIGCALIPYGTGLRSRVGMKLEDCLVFVQYHGLAYVEDLFLQEENAKMQALLQAIQPNVGKLHVLPKDEKHIRRKLRLHPTEDLLELCKSVVLSANKVFDGGEISYELQDEECFNPDAVLGHYCCLSNGQHEVWLNSVSMRVYKVVKI